MRRIAVLLLFVAGCRTVTAVPNNTLEGGATPRASVDRFLAAARAQDLQALGADFGDSRGALRDYADRATTERRLLIMLQCLRHDKAVVSAPSRGEGGTQVFTVDFTQQALTASVKFVVARGPSNRWYVQQFDIVTLQNRGFCSKPEG